MLLLLSRHMFTTHAPMHCSSLLLVEVGLGHPVRIKWGMGALGGTPLHGKGAGRRGVPVRML